LWPPFEADVTELLRRGRNTIEIELVGSRRNLLGPLHYIQDRPVWTGAEQFHPPPEEYRQRYSFVPYGLLSPPVLSFRRKAV